MKMIITKVRLPGPLYEQLIAQTKKSLSLPWKDRVSLNTVIIKTLEKGLKK